MRNIDALSDRVRRHGGKVTAQRLLIWHALQDDRSHPTADDLFARLRHQAPTLSLTTVYSVLNELVEWGEVRRFDTGDGCLHFDPNLAAHAELICMRCHSVSDAPTDPPHAAHLSAAVPDEIAGFRVVTRSEQYYGYCPTCQHALAP